MNLREELNAFYYSTALNDLKLMNMSFSDESITYNSLLYLEIIHYMNGECTVSALAELLHISKPGVTLKINELLKKGLVTKTTDKNDKRKKYLAVNENKIPQFLVYRRQDDMAVKTLNEQFSPEEVEKFCQMLHILTKVNNDEANNQ